MYYINFKRFSFSSVVLNLFLIHFSGSTSPCEDKVVSGLAATYKGEIWFKNDIWVSFDACSPDNIQNNSKLSTNFVRYLVIGEGMSQKHRTSFMHDPLYEIYGVG